MNQLEPKIISEISSSLEINLSSTASNEEIKSALRDHINYLITHDFNRLVAILYRIDISEKLLKTKLQMEDRDAGSIIAEMIIDRQIEKIKTKREFKSGDNISNEETW